MIMELRVEIRARQISMVISRTPPSPKIAFADK